MSEISGRAIKDVAEQGSTLVFIVYPEAIATMKVMILFHL